MKFMNSRSAFTVGFLVGTCTLYVFLQQVWFERKASIRQPEERNWLKNRSALFNLNHPHHTGECVYSILLTRMRQLSFGIQNTMGQHS